MDSIIIGEKDNGSMCSDWKTKHISLVQSHFRYAEQNGWLAMQDEYSVEVSQSYSEKTAQMKAYRLAAI